MAVAIFLMGPGKRYLFNGDSGVRYKFFWGVNGGGLSKICLREILG